MPAASEGLAHIHHVDRAIDMVCFKLDLRQRQVFGQVKGGAITAQQDITAVLFFLESQLFIDADDDRATLGRSSSAIPAGDQLIHDGFGGFIHFAFEEPHVHLDIEHAEDIVELVQAPLAGLQPQARRTCWIASIPLR